MAESDQSPDGPPQDRLFYQPTDTKFWYPTETEAEERLLATYEHRTESELQEGLTWYSDVHNFARQLASEYNLEESLGPQAYVHVAGIIAVLSPRLEWEQNLEAAEGIIRDRTYNGLQRATRSALQMLDGTHPEEELYQPGNSAFKIQAFFDNIRDPEGSYRVTLDRHMWNLIYAMDLPVKVMQSKMGIDVYNWAKTESAQPPRNWV